MGYEVTYKYYERDEEGGYNKEEIKEIRKKVGDPFEEVPLEKLAAAVMAQLARRDIWVTDVDVYELSRKSISFRETKGGIVIKNKKFLFDTDSNIVVQDMVEAPVQQPMSYTPQQQQLVSAPQQQMQPHQMQPHQMQPHNGGQMRPIDWVVFAPELPMMSEVKQKNLRFTPDKKYPVFQKQPSVTGIGEVYKMIDDTGREQLVSDKYFVPGNINLFADRELGFSENQTQRDGGNLLWGNATLETDMPVIRR